MFLFAIMWFLKKVVFAEELNSIIELTYHISFVVLEVLYFTSKKCHLFYPLLVCEQQVMIPWAGSSRQEPNGCLSLASMLAATLTMQHLSSSCTKQKGGSWMPYSSAT